MSNMPDSNKSWKSTYIFIEGSDWVCHPEKWVTIPCGFDNTWGIIKALGLSPTTFVLFLTPSAFSLYCFVYRVLMSSFCFSFLACVRPLITNEQEAFIHWVLEIPFE